MLDVLVASWLCNLKYPSYSRDGYFVVFFTHESFVDMHIIFAICDTAVPCCGGNVGGGDCVWKDDWLPWSCYRLHELGLCKNGNFGHGQL